VRLGELWFAIVEDEQKFLTAVTFIADEMGGADLRKTIELSS